jgi:hypothetical protein
VLVFLVFRIIASFPTADELALLLPFGGLFGDRYPLCGLSGISRINSIDSYCPLMNPSRAGHSGCIQGLETIAKWCGMAFLESVSTSSDVEELGLYVRAADEEIRRVTKSRGAVGPGNCAERW